MPIISSIESRSLSMRLLYGGMYLLLTVGAASMIYPLLVMISGSFKSETDIGSVSPVPTFFFDRDLLYRKFLEAKYNNRISLLCAGYHAAYSHWRNVAVPADDDDAQLVTLYQEFAAQTWPESWQFCGHFVTPQMEIVPFNGRRFRGALSDHFGGSIAAFNEQMNSGYSHWMYVDMPEEDLVSRRYQAADSILTRLFAEFKLTRPVEERFFVNPDGHFYYYYLRPLYGEEIADYNAAHQTDYQSYDEVLLTARAPLPEQQRKDWEQFVRKELSINFIRLDAAQAPKFQEFLRERYGDIGRLNRSYEAQYDSFQSVSLPEVAPPLPVMRSDWTLFLEQDADAEGIEVVGPRQKFEEFLDAQGYSSSPPGTTDLLGRAMRAADRADFLKNRDWYFWEFIKRNYLQVFDFILMHGRGIVNTVVYCALAVLGAMIVNPLAAYALSRYHPPSTYKLLLLCMATMAFPPAVTLIPSFLLLRNLHLINTFAALVLPGLANGYLIFLLKGFFDSLPRDLYEAADIDGAGEWKKFWIITMSLSRPILAVVALNAFTFAYSNFMFVLIVAPDQKMWTLMVWLFQLQMRVHTSVTYAALIVAAVPTFVVFLFAQKAIMRGIVVPVEK